MKLSTSDAAREFGLHPANLLLSLASMGPSFDEIWPEIDENWIDTLRSISGHHEIQTETSDADSGGDTNSHRPVSRLSVSFNAGIVVEKLYRNNRWSSLTVRLESLQRHTHLQKDVLEVAVEDLLRRGLLLKHGDGTYSLDSGERAEIERIAQVMISRKDAGIPSADA